MNGSSNETWVDIMSTELAQPSKKTSKNRGVTITPNTPRTSSRQHSRIGLGGPQGQVEILKSQVVNLLQEKQELSKKVQWEKSQRECIEREIEHLKTKRINNKSVTFHDDSSYSSSPSQLQLSALREALEVTTQERNTLRDLLTKEKDCSSLLNTQLIEERTQNCRDKASLLKDKEELEGARTQLKQMRQELATMNHLVKKQKDENALLHQEEQLTQTQEQLSQIIRERDALRERLTTVETHRQLSMEQYQEEVETSVLAVTTQLEELLELNRQLQEELNHSQTERDEFSLALNEIKRDKEVLKQEKNQLSIESEQKIKELKTQLQQTKQSFQKKDAASDSQHDNVLILKQQIEKTKRELKQQTQSAETLQNDLTHQITLLKQEKESLIEQKESTSRVYDKVKLDCKRLEDDVRTLHANLTHSQREKGTIEAQLITVRAELSTSQDYCTQLKKDINELRDVSKLQTESLSKQLTQQLKDSEAHNKLLQSNVKRLESELEEMVLVHQKETKTHQGQLEATQTSNQQLQIKVADLEKDVAFQKKQTIDCKKQLETMRHQNELKQVTIQDLEKTINTLSTELTDNHKYHDKNHSLLSQIRNLKDTVASLQLERDNLNQKLRNTLEENSVTEEELKEENTKLHELLDNSLSLNEKLQSSTTSGSFDSSLHANIKLSPITNFQTPPSRHGTGLSSPPSVHYSSPAAEIVHLRQELSKARENCLKLERQQAQDATEMAKIQGSLQALVKIQDHLGKENKSLTQTFVNLEEEKDVYKQETERLNKELTTSQDNLKVLNLEIDTIIGTVLAQLREISTQNHFNNLSADINNILDDKEEELKLEIIPKIIQLLSSLIHNSDNDGRSDSLKEEVVLLQERVSKACSQLQVMEDELETKEKELEGKERELIAMRIEGERQVNIESFKKDLETQYQAKLTVVRSKLMEREDEVSELQMSEQELKTQLNDAQVIATSSKEELMTVKGELSILREMLAHYEASLTSETSSIEKEIEHQTHLVATMKSELAQLKSQQNTQTTDDKKSEMRTSDDRIYELQSQVEMLRAKKGIFDKYVATQEANEDMFLSQQKDDIMQENLQLSVENNELKQELVGITSHMQDQIDILVLRLEEVQEEAQQDRELEKKEIEEFHQNQAETELERMRQELERARNEFEQSYSLLESKFEREKTLCNQVESQRDALTRDIQSMKDEMETMNTRHQNELAVLTDRLHDKEVVCADVQSSLEHVMADKEALTVRLNESCPTDSSLRNNKKVEKLKDKLKQQIRQTNHIRMKLGYALSELRLYKQLKSQLDYQVRQLQEALDLSQQEYNQCLHKLNKVDVNHSYHHET